MTSPITYPVDDKDLDDAALWAVIDSAAAASLSSTTKSRKPLASKHTNHPIPFSIPSPSPPPAKFPKNPRNNHYYSPENDFRALTEGEVLHRPSKMARSCVSELSETSPLVMVKHVQRLPTTPSYSCSPTASECSPPLNYRQSEEKENIMRHSLSGQFPSVSLFKEYQNAAMAILEKSDYTMISGSPFIKKTGFLQVGGRYRFISISPMKLKTRRLSLMRTGMFFVLNLWFEHTCRLVGFQMGGAHVNGVRRDF